ncbi:MAG: RsmD family RNA methyltransferase [Prevotellaceae bacterium]|jgi:16S rRNA (guanine(966)-N(2))-methyltransferase RsmD|nr:RsmD family RNA methyltransferase [Prevotellaceae bacterium]
MRIISGKYKAMRFEPPTTITARPTTDFAKESLFNVLTHYVDFEGLRVLDLFSGTGSISYEFASRGAVEVTAVEMSERHIAFIKKIIHKLNINQMRVLRADVFRYIEHCTATYDVVFADPPYQLDNIAALPDAIINRQLLSESGVCVLEHGAANSFVKHPCFVEERKYGNVHFSFFKPIHSK